MRSGRPGALNMTMPILAVVSDIPEVHDAAQAVGLVTFGLDDEEAIADYIATHIARSGR